jgi:hypothetical protein
MVNIEAASGAKRKRNGCMIAVIIVLVLFGLFILLAQPG